MWFDELLTGTNADTRKQRATMKPGKRSKYKLVNCEDLVSLREFADYNDIPFTNLQVYINREKDTPTPVYQYRRVRVFDQNDLVEWWNKRMDRIYNRGDDED